MKLKKQFIGSCVIALMIMLSACATTSQSGAGSSDKDDEAVISQGSVEHFVMGALIAAPLAFAVPIVVLAIAGV